MWSIQWPTNPYIVWPIDLSVLSPRTLSNCHLAPDMVAPSPRLQHARKFLPQAFEIAVALAWNVFPLHICIVNSVTFCKSLFKCHIDHHI